MAIKHSVIKTSQERGYASEWNDNHIIDGDVDFGKYEALNFVTENRTTYPAGPSTGQLIFVSGKLMVWTGSAWDYWTRAATVTVAADGSGDFLTVQEGIDALPVGGGVVHVLEGTYTITAPILFGVNSTSLIGVGTGTLITTTEDIVCINTNGKSGCLISDLKISGAGSGKSSNTGINLSGADSRVDRCWVTNCGADGLMINGARCNIGNSHFYLNYDEGIVAGGANAIINGNHIYQNYGEGIYCGSNFCSIVGNEIWENRSDGVLCSLNAFATTVSANLIQHNGNITGNGDGVDIRNSSNENIVTGNVIKDNGDWGVTIAGANAFYNVCVGNSIRNNSSGATNDAGTGSVVANNS